MRILFTGSSSFTGYWFIRELVQAGHEVVATFQRGPADYDGIRARRAQMVDDLCRTVYSCSFGQQAFMDVVKGEASWDALCHHAADVTDYKSPAFDVPRAIANNTYNVAEVLASLADRGCRRVILTGSVFEQREGEGEHEYGGLRPFSPYGLSKGLTADMFRYYVREPAMSLGKFVIPNPFGPYEEPRFTAYLLRTWMAHEVAGVKTPDYVRDNIHVSLLAKAYRDFMVRLSTEPEYRQINPSGYIETQGAFAERFAREMRPRLNLPCELRLGTQTDFTEPLKRVNTDPLDARALGWDETQAWDDIANYYEVVQSAAS